jgi:hypothetical protein
MILQDYFFDMHQRDTSLDSRAGESKTVSRTQQSMVVSKASVLKCLISNKNIERRIQMWSENNRMYDEIVLRPTSKLIAYQVRVACRKLFCVHRSHLLAHGLQNIALS